MNKELKDTLLIFLIWRLIVTIGAMFGIYFFSNNNLFLGGGLDNYLKSPLFWGWGNFDGEHYVAIALRGYENLTYFYFPFYPLIINMFSKYILNLNLLSTNLVGIVISNVSFYFALLGLYKLLKIDFKLNQVKFILLTLILFPTSFYFASVYTESLYLLVVVWSFYLIRTKKIFSGFILSIFSSAIRVVGISLMPALAFESINLKNIKLKNIVYLLFPSLGLIFYMIYLYLLKGDPFLFNRQGEIFGEYKSSNMTILPIVFYRYLFKVIPNLNFNYFFGTYVSLQEFLVGTIFLFLIIRGFFKLRKSYWVYLTIGYIMPTMYNNFVSLPRYVLVLFPAFILVGTYLHNKSIFIKIFYFLISTIFLVISTGMFIRGIWVA